MSWQTVDPDLPKETRMMPAPIAQIPWLLRPFVPTRAQIVLRRMHVARRRRKAADIWPILHEAAKAPDCWHGWPDGKRFAVILTHDVETASGQAYCQELMFLEQLLGFRSSFNFAPGRYPDSPELRGLLGESGFEIGVHGVGPDRKLFRSHAICKQQAERINKYLEHWHGCGFRSLAMRHNPEWLRMLDIDYDASTFDMNPFESQSDEVRTIFPFWVAGTGPGQGYVELPNTMPQDFTLFVLMKERDTSIWRQKLDWVAENGGMVLMNTHPDYMRFKGVKPSCENYPVDYYVDILKYLNHEYRGTYWHGLPREVAAFLTQQWRAAA